VRKKKNTDKQQLKNNNNKKYIRQAKHADQGIYLTMMIRYNKLLILDNNFFMKRLMLLWMVILCRMVHGQSLLTPFEKSTGKETATYIE